MTTTQQFSHEKLEVYQLALSFVGWLANLLPELKANKEARIGEVVDQIDRASTSIVLNLAEGNGRRATKQRARFFDDARGSATECAGCLDLMVAKRLVSAERVEEGKTIFVRVVSMLTKLVDRYDK